MRLNKQFLYEDLLKYRNVMIGLQIFFLRLGLGLWAESRYIQLTGLLKNKSVFGN